MTVQARAALDAYELHPATLAPLPGGLINLSFLVESPRGRFVLQRLHPVFGAPVNDDIEAITSHLAARGLVTPRMVCTRAGSLCVAQPDGVWRLQTFITGETVHRVDSPARAEAAGNLVGRFHAAVADLEHDFHFRRAGVHDTAHHFGQLDEAIAANSGHPEHAVTARLRDELREGLSALPAIDGSRLPRRIAHGDLKISNLLFDAAGDGICLVDLDTMAHMPLPFELGDAWRSWCNPLGEDVSKAGFELEPFGAAWRGYAGVMGQAITDEERTLLVPGVATICLELSARFLRDVLEDRYFGWDRARFPSRAAHNRVRAEGQASLFRSLMAQRAAAERLLAA